jgi:hypothetical protein
MDLYIYYRVPAAHTSRLRPLVQAMQQRLANESGIVGQLKRRPEETDGRQTWMEVYAAVPDGFNAALERAVAEAGLSGMIEGNRHTEIFVDLSACA